MRNRTHLPASSLTKEILVKRIRAARMKEPCDLVVKGTTYLDVFTGQFQKGDIAVSGGVIVGIKESYQGTVEIDGEGLVAVPGFIDAHVHIESSLMTPIRYQESVLPRGTTTAIWDPHEIANVKGVAGIDWALKATEELLLDVFVMVPSCVPSTSPSIAFETSGASLIASDIAKYKGHPRVLGLAEMMNFPGLLDLDGDVLDKVLSYQDLRIDGHCPGLRGADLNAYAAVGIHTCHESTSRAEALEKLEKGIALLVREGSCAKNALELLPLVTAYSSACVGLCSDDRNPLDIEEQGHIDYIIRLGLSKNMNPVDLFRAASFGAARLYGLKDRGALAPGYLADICLLRPKSKWRDGFDIVRVFKEGKAVDSGTLHSQSAASESAPFAEKNLKLAPLSAQSFSLSSHGRLAPTVEVIGVIPNQIITERLRMKALVGAQGELLADPANDLLKIAVIERHRATGQIGLGFVSGFNLKRGAIASSINHDSHNIIVVGASDDAMHKAVERLCAIDGGIVVFDGVSTYRELSLPIGGLMSNMSPDDVATTLRILKSLTREMGCKLDEPFLQLSFLALPVIGKIKITDRGLVDVEAFRIIDSIICD